jgi:hypothetical protein
MGLIPKSGDIARKKRCQVSFQGKNELTPILLDTNSAALNPGNGLPLVLKPWHTL